MYVCVCVCVCVCVLLEQRSVQHEGAGHLALLFHVEDEVPEVDTGDALPAVLP